MTCDLQAGGLLDAGREEWLAAYTRPRHEEKVRQFCELLGIEAFVPTHWTWRRWSDRRKLLASPLFPSYVFLKPPAREKQRVFHAPGFLWYVQACGVPVRVDVDELSAIRRLLASGWEFDPLPTTKCGDEVEIVRGPMRGCRGYLLNKEEQGVVLRIAAIACGVRVHLPDASWVRPVRRTGNSLKHGGPVRSANGVLTSGKTACKANRVLADAANRTSSP